MRVRVDLRLPGELLARVDAKRGDVSRTKFFERALERDLASDKEPVVAPTERRKIRSAAAGLSWEDAAMDRQRRLNRSKGL